MLKAHCLVLRLEFLFIILRGVKFKNRSTVFIGEDVIIDPINPSNVEIGDRCLITAGAKILTHYIDTKNRSKILNIISDFMMEK